MRRYSHRKVRDAIGQKMHSHFLSKSSVPFMITPITLGIGDEGTWPEKSEATMIVALAAETGIKAEALDQMNPQENEFEDIATPRYPGYYISADEGQLGEERVFSFGKGDEEWDDRRRRRLLVEKGITPTSFFD